MNYFVYILKCNDGSLYTGYTTDIEKRVATHNQKKGAKYTRSRLPVTLVYSHRFSEKRLALQAEYLIKKQSRQNKEKLLKKELTLEQLFEQYYPTQSI